MTINLYTLYDSVVANLRQPVEMQPDGAGGYAFTFVPALTVAEQAKLADLLLMARFGITADLTLAEFQAIKPDLATAKTYAGIASPTAAQTNAALKATIRVIGALLRA